MLERLSRPGRGFGNGTARAVDAIYRVLGRPGKLLQDFMNGSWLGHSLHAVLVDVVIGGATAALLLDVLRVFFDVGGLETATTWVLGLAWLAGIGAILTGLTDFKDTAPNSAERDVTITHGIVNFLGSGGFALSLSLRTGGSHDAAFWALLVAYLLISIGGYIGGHIVFKYGYMVNHNAFARGTRAKDFKPVVALSELQEETPTKVTLGTTALMLVRRGDVVHALKDTCSHAGGPLSEGKLEGDTITCPWHYSTFRITDGSVVHGPAGSRQVHYRTRVTDGQVELQGPHD